MIIGTSEYFQAVGDRGGNVGGVESNTNVLPLTEIRARS